MMISQCSLRRQNLISFLRSVFIGVQPHKDFHFNAGFSIPAPVMTKVIANMFWLYACVKTLSKRVSLSMLWKKSWLTFEKAKMIPDLQQINEGVLHLFIHSRRPHMADFCFLHNSRDVFHPGNNWKYMRHQQLLKDLHCIYTVYARTKTFSLAWTTGS